MANYLDGVEGGKHNSDNTEVNIEPKNYTVSVTFTDMDAKDPLDATKKACRWLLENDGAQYLIYEVQDEITGNKYTVDLAEDDDNAVLPNND